MYRGYSVKLYIHKCNGFYMQTKYVDKKRNLVTIMAVSLGSDLAYSKEFVSESRTVYYCPVTLVLVIGINFNHLVKPQRS